MTSRATFPAALAFVVSAGLITARAQSPRPPDPTVPLSVQARPAASAPRLLTVGLTGQQPPPSAAQEGFVPADQLPKPQETLPAAPLLATAYAFVWLLLFGYVFSIWRRLANVEREMQTVSRRIGPTGGRTP